VVRKIVLAAVMAATAFTSAAMAEGKKIGVSWSNFSQERWKFDAAAMRSSIQRAGNDYVTMDAEYSAEKQLQDIRAMIDQGIDALVIVPVDQEAILPAIGWAAEAGVPVIAYDRLIEDPRVFYLTFDNVGVGRIIAAVVKQEMPEGNYVIIKGDESDANTGFLRRGMEEIIGPSVAGGTIKIVAEVNIDGWKPEGALEAMTKILADSGNQVDAVLAQNDGMAGGVAEALAAQGMNVPLGGQDGDPGAINRVAQGLQTVSVWKNNIELGKIAGKIANQLADGVAMERVPDAVKFSDGEKGVELNAILLTPTAITKDSIYIAIDADHISQKDACKNALPGVRGCE
jgi:D-xylose transport system substrate-binding protein